MLRFLVLVLVLANGIFFAWSGGWLRAYGFGPAPQSEPQRMAQQVRPEAVHVLTPAEYQRVQAQLKADHEPKSCLQAGPFDATQVAVLERALPSMLPVGAWHFDAVTVPERWIVYMGKFPNDEALVKKRGELTAMNINPQAVGNPSMAPGLALASFATQAEATTELTRLGQRGIRTAKVVQESPAGAASQLTVPALTEPLKLRLADLKTALAGRALKPCEK